MRKRVVEHVTVGFENIPIWPRDTISSFVAVDYVKVKWAVNECILICARLSHLQKGSSLYQAAYSSNDSEGQTRYVSVKMDYIPG
jgi:hypothetical protein